MNPENQEHNLHRLQNNKNDWDGVPVADLSMLQRIAKRSHGVLTLANAITITSTVAVINGLVDFANGQRASGVLKVMAGRAGDLADGAIADTTSTKGRIGRDLDPTVDAIQLAVALPVLEHTGYLPLIPAVLMGSSKVIDTLGAVAARARSRELNPTHEGKIGAFAFWTGIGSFMLRGALDHRIPGFADTALETIGWAGTVGGTAYHVPANIEYLRGGFGANQEPIGDTASTQREI